MEFQKIVNLLDKTFDDKDLPRFITKKEIEAYNQSRENDNVNNEIRIKTWILRPDLRDLSDAYIVVKRIITFTEPDNSTRKKSVALQEILMMVMMM